MPACPTCGFTLTYKEWSLGNCTSCSSPLQALSKSSDPIAATKKAADVTIPAAARPGWGTVRAGMALIIFALGMFWIGIAYFETPFHDRHQFDLMFITESGVITCFSLGFAGLLMCTVMPGPCRSRFWAWAGCCLLLLSSVLLFKKRLSDPGLLGIEHMAHGAWILGVSAFGMSFWLTAAFFKRNKLALNLFLILIAGTALNGFHFLRRFEADRLPSPLPFDLLRTPNPGDNGTWIGLIAFALSAWFAVCLYLLRKRITQLLREEPDAA